MKGGEDAWFNNSMVLCIADGVGGWNEVGVDSAKYSRKLIDNLKNTFHADPEIYSRNPKSLSVKAVKENNEIGSSTLVVATIDPVTNKLNTSNLGDSGFLILTPKNGIFAKKFKSEEQQHSFNFPFQVGTNGDNPELADFKDIRVNKGDIIIMGSDGLFDNVYEEDIIKLVNETSSKSKIDLKAITDKIANKAFKNSLNHEYLSPFAKHAQ